MATTLVAGLQNRIPTTSGASSWYKMSLCIQGTAHRATHTNTVTLKRTHTHTHTHTHTQRKQDPIMHTLSLTHGNKVDNMQVIVKLLSKHHTTFPPNRIKICA
jgi:hypothetical protein